MSLYLKSHCLGSQTLVETKVEKVGTKDGDTYVAHNKHQRNVGNYNDWKRNERRSFEKRATESKKP